MARTVLFQIHWFLGITAGLVLAVMGVTGATISFQDEILVGLNRGVMTIQPSQQNRLSTPQLTERFLDRFPEARITRVVVWADPARSVRVSYIPAEGAARETRYVHPYSGEILGPATGSAFFETVIHLHRWLALPGEGDGIGRQITGFAALSLIFFALSGLYLRWPRKPLDWRAWLVLDLRRTGRNLYHALHTVIGVWVLAFYLVSALSGLYWSYSWYQDGMRAALVGEEQTATIPERDKDTAADIPVVWQAFEQATAPARYEMITASFREGGAVAFRAKLPGGRHDRVSDEISIDGVDGTVLSHEPYAERPLGKDVMTSIYEIHRGAYFGILGRIGIMLAALTMPLFTITGFLLYFARRRTKRALAEQRAASDTAAVSLDEATTLVAFASQTGTAERLARLTADALPGAAAIPLNRLDAARVAKAGRIFVIASTYGEGDPPDMARALARRMESEKPDLAHLRYAVLALGDREYPDFCAFGHRLDQWFHACGAERLFDLVEMDAANDDAQRQWQQQLGGLGARTDMPDWAPARMANWRLAERRLLNPGSSGGPAWHIALEPPASQRADWQAGDILEIMPQQDRSRIGAFARRAGMELTDEQEAWLATRILPPEGEPIPHINDLRPLAHREYSIASIPASGSLELIVRQCTADDGFPGLGSGWLTQGAPIGQPIEARVRSNPGFHSPGDPAVPLLLIGNGTGMAGLLAHVRQRAASGGAPVWLFWGERHPDHDAFHMPELAQFIDHGVIGRACFAWSRSGASRAYVQDTLRANAAAIASFIASGASIYVCGSIDGMAPAVHQTLVDIVGDDTLETMTEAGLYRRDIY